MQKPAYYLWKSDFSSNEAFETEKEKYKSLGFRVVAYLDGESEKDIHESLLAVINHYMQAKT